MTGGPAISVVMPVYGGEALLAEAIQSVLDQSFADFELLIVSEYGNSRRSVEIIAAFTDPRIRPLYNEERLGFVKSVNRGFREARGRYLARLDADDQYLRHTLETLFAYMEAHPDISFCHAGQMSPTGETGALPFSMDSPEDIRAGLLLNWVINHPYFWRRDDFVSRNLFFDPAHAMEDYELMTRAARELNFAAIREPLYVYRESPGSLTSSKMNALVLDTRRIILENLRGQLGLEVPEADAYLFQMWRNPFTLLTGQRRRAAYKNFLFYLDLVLRKNKERRAFDQASLFKSVLIKHEITLGRPLPLNFDSDGCHSDPAGRLRALRYRNRLFLRHWPSRGRVFIKRFAFKMIRPFWRVFSRRLSPLFARLIQPHMDQIQSRLDELSRERSHSDDSSVQETPIDRKSRPL